jgi:glutamine amidotransferase-like uncharacterized protein
MKGIFLILTFVFLSSTLQSKEIWIYSDEGAWTDGIIAFEQFLDHIGEPHKRVYADDLNNPTDYNNAKAICFPGGFSYNYKVKLHNKTINNIRNYVAKGGSYIGICAGAFFAASTVVWEGLEYDYSLGLFKGKAVGSIYEIAPWDNYKMTEIAINRKNPIIGNSNSELSVLYYGGPYFESEQTEYDTVAVWKENNNKTAIINFNYQNGKVLLIGPHLEIEENSDRDSTNFAENLDDIASDWELLESVIKWTISSESGLNDNDYVLPKRQSDICF